MGFKKTTVAIGWGQGRPKTSQSSFGKGSLGQEQSALAQLEEGAGARAAWLETSREITPDPFSYKHFLSL